MARLSATVAELVHALSYEGLATDAASVRRWASGSRRIQAIARVGQFERALQRIARDRRPPLDEIEDGELQRHWFGADGGHAEPVATPDGSPRPAVSAAGVGDLGTVCVALLARSRRRDDFVTQIPRVPVPYSGIVVRPVQGLDAQRLQVAGNDIEDAARDFLLAEAGLLVVLGVFGSGKSEVLRRMADAMLQSHRLLPLLLNFSDIGSSLTSMDAVSAVHTVLAEVSSEAAEEFRVLTAKNPDRCALLIDAYDEANLSAEDEKLIPGPGPTWLTQLLDSGMRVVVSARQTSAVDADSFVQLIRTAEARMENRRAPGFYVLELAPCRREDVLDSLSLLPVAKARTMRRYFEADSSLQMESARRPLFLKMVADMDPGARPADEPISLYRLYDLYVNKTLERDHRAGSSKIPVEKKRLILEHIAHTMFIHQIDHGAARIATTEASNLVTAYGSVLTIAESGKPSGDHSSEDTPFADFERSNHILVPEGVGRASARARAFVHHTLYEFFLANYFDTNLATEGTFGLPDDHRALRAFDSLLPYFIRALMDDNIESREDDLVNMVRTTASSNSDKLLGLFLLEDSQYILDLLHGTSAAYLEFLRQTEGPSESFFMSKVARFQLILAEGSIGRALWYVSDLRVREVQQHVDIETHTFGDQPNPTDFLLQRLDNPLLQAAAPVAVYRLGQRGDYRAIPHLERYGEHPDPAFRAIAVEAMERVRHRHQGAR